MARAYTQKEHEKINRREYPGTREICCICEDPTGRAGRGEDSIYCDMKENFELYDCPFKPFLESMKGKELGPVCEDCYGELIDNGLIVE